MKERKECYRSVPGTSILNEDIKERMKKALRENGYNIKNFAESHGFSRKVFHNPNTPSVQVLLAVANATGYTIDYFVRG